MGSCPGKEGKGELWLYYSDRFLVLQVSCVAPVRLQDLLVQAKEAAAAAVPTSTFAFLLFPRSSTRTTSRRVQGKVEDEALRCLRHLALYRQRDVVSLTPGTAGNTYAKARGSFEGFH